MRCLLFPFRQKKLSNPFYVLYTHKRQNPSHTSHTLVAANHAALHNAACTHTGSYQTHRRDGHPATRGITQLLASLPPSPSAHSSTTRPHATHAQKVAHLVQTHTKVRETSSHFFNRLKMVLRSTGGELAGSSVGRAG